MMPNVSPPELSASEAEPSVTFWSAPPNPNVWITVVFKAISLVAGPFEMENLFHLHTSNGG